MKSKYKLEEYNSIYKKQYSQELKKLTKFLKKYNPKIEHFGSSAVPALEAKELLILL